MADISIAKEQDANFDAGATFCGIFERLARCTAYERAALFYALECRWCWECGVEQMNEIAHAGCSVERIVASLRAENERLRKALEEMQGHPPTMSDTHKKVAEVFHPSTYILDEIQARDWRWSEFVEALQGSDPEDWVPCAAELLVRQLDGVSFGDEEARRLGRAFGTSAELWLNLQSAWGRLKVEG